MERVLACARLRTRESHARACYLTCDLYCKAWGVRVWASKAWGVRVWASKAWGVRVWASKAGVQGSGLVKLGV